MSPATTALKTADAVFAANRAVGRVTLEAKLSAGMTRRARVREQGSLRVRCPGQPAHELEAVIVNSAGGIAGGDRFEIDVRAGLGARVAVTTAAAEKIYRTLDADATVRLRLSVADSGHIAWLPQETILFNHSRLRRTIDVELAESASILIAESVIFGRSGMGETVGDGALFDRWRVRRDGALLYAETVKLDGAVSDRLRWPAVANGGIAVATVLCIPGNEEVVAAVRACDGKWQGEVGASAWNGIAVVRLVAADGAALRQDLVAVLTAIRGASLPRLWLN